MRFSETRMTASTDRLQELMGRLWEAYEVGSPLLVQQRLLSDFTVCLELRGWPPPRYEAPLSQEVLRALEGHLTVGH